jgi:hypothetical protein
MLSAGTKKRLSRIRRRATPEVQAAFDAGHISARRADTLLYLEPKEQLAELNRLLVARQDVQRRSQIAAAVIKQHLDAGRRDLVALREDLRKALCSLTLQSHA